MPITRGKIATERTIVEVKALTRDDLACLTDGARAINTVARFRDPHHRVARLFAAGIRKMDMPERTGYSIQRIETLWADPAFQELIAKYREMVDAEFKENIDHFYEQASANMRKAETMLAEKLEEYEELGELPPTKDLIAIVADRADRFGYGKKETRVNVNLDFAAQLERAIARSKTIDATPVREVSPPLSQAAGAPPASTPAGAQPRAPDPPRTPEQHAAEPQPSLRRRA